MSDNEDLSILADAAAKSAKAPKKPRKQKVDSPRKPRRGARKSPSGRSKSPKRSVVELTTKKLNMMVTSPKKMENSHFAGVRPTIRRFVAIAAGAPGVINEDQNVKDIRVPVSEKSLSAFEYFIKAFLKKVVRVSMELHHVSKNVSRVNKKDLKNDGKYQQLLKAVKAAQEEYNDVYKPSKLTEAERKELSSNEIYNSAYRYYTKTRDDLREYLRVNKPSKLKTYTISYQTVNDVFTRLLKMPNFFNVAQGGESAGEIQNILSVRNCMTSISQIKANKAKAMKRKGTKESPKRRGTSLKQKESNVLSQQGLLASKLSKEGDYRRQGPIYPSCFIMKQVTVARMVNGAIAELVMKKLPTDYFIFPQNTVKTFQETYPEFIYDASTQPRLAKFAKDALYLIHYNLEVNLIRLASSALTSMSAANKKTLQPKFVQGAANMMMRDPWVDLFKQEDSEIAIKRAFYGGMVSSSPALKPSGGKMLRLKIQRALRASSPTFRSGAIRAEGSKKAKIFTIKTKSGRTIETTRRRAKPQIPFVKDKLGVGISLSPKIAKKRTRLILSEKEQKAVESRSPKNKRSKKNKSEGTIGDMGGEGMKKKKTAVKTLGKKQVARKTGKPTKAAPVKKGKSASKTKAEKQADEINTAQLLLGLTQ